MRKLVCGKLVMRCIAVVELWNKEEDSELELPSMV